MSIDTEVAWAGGLFEGEGCIHYRKRGKKFSASNMRLSVGSTDLDSLERFMAAVSAGKIYGPYNYKSSPYKTKPFYTWAVNTLEEVLDVLSELWPYLNSRRQDRAIHLLSGGVS